MLRTILLLVAGLFLAIFVLSSNADWMKAWVEYRSEALKLPSDKYRYGDLYGFSYLAHFQKAGSPLLDLRRMYVKRRPVTNVQLYSICDSYLWSFMPNDSLLRHADGYRFSRWGYEAKQFHLDASKRNILLLEMVERRVRSTVADTAQVYIQLGVVGPNAQETIADMAPVSWWERHIFNKNIEQNLEFNLFDYPLFTQFKEWKAQLNYELFHRKSPDVVISKTQDQLYYASTVDSTVNTSSFHYLPAGELNTLVTSLNHIYHHYRQAGFAEVYLAVMPNPVTVLEPTLGIYNGLIPRLQRHPALLMPVIDVYAKFRQLRKQPIYQISDSHWSRRGFLVGVALIDSALATQSNLKRTRVTTP